MSKAPLLEIEPKELKFMFELKKQSSCSVQLTNNTYHHVAFKVKTTSPRKYSVRPNVGVLMPNATCEFIVTMQAQRVAPEDMVCKDKFLIQSTMVPAETASEDVTSSLFVKDGSKYIEENKLKVTLISPPESPDLSPINGDFKNGLDYEKIPIYSKDEIQSPEPMVLKNPDIVHEVLKLEEDSELKLEEDTELKPEHDVGLDTLKVVGEPIEKTGLKVSKNEELSIIKDVEELKPQKKLELEVSRDMDLNNVKNAEELKPEKAADLHVSKVLDFGTINNVKELKPEKEKELKVSKDMELKTVKDVEDPKQEKEAELRVSKSVEELKLIKAIEEMKLKLDGLESKLNESGVTISKLTEERRLSIQETKILQEKLADLIDKGPRKVQVGFPLLYVCMVALICVILGYRLHS
ncbi:vesicle-associated protein 2-2 [Abrus precatorius]|uniref:Vesicle-associated protein 2-2 n=1 Tax=Abrus precatorius TaxID=3816 RepID=A0A8B8MD18_ABRPR|nr:vesicle-associated protein 2-2 [Abrus precatorius]